MPGRLAVADDRRHLTRDGRPWFLFGDTAWELFHRLGDQDTDDYLTTRAEQGFNTVLAVLVGEFGGADVPNAEGELPFAGRTGSRPNPRYWEHADRTVWQANQRGLTMGLLPCWGSYWSEPDELFSTPDLARPYARWVAERYADADVIWVLGGDRTIDCPRHRDVVNAFADGIREVVGSSQLITFHPREASKDDVGAADWMDFDLIQSGHHGWAPPNYQLIEQLIAQRPQRPVIDGEPNYEAHPVMDPRWRASGDWTFTDADARRAVYHSVFAGAAGHVYGANGSYQFLVGGQADPVHGGTGDWREALQLPGARQVAAAVRLFGELQISEWEPRQDLLTARIGSRAGHVRAMARRDRTAVAVYAPRRKAGLPGSAAPGAGPAERTVVEPAERCLGGAVADHRPAGRDRQSVPAGRSAGGDRCGRRLTRRAGR
ncbi:DUF4038 domain-containing protein [Microlunatus sp. Gsoil 973]|uniref:apiosidase-like domain-containing protein n=1 Tax=Microlunatus sp. Gsoil 973 TaxID=2672569 RepID=UPI0012B4F98B|nr:DUF4038 domain-containing protein [Microlunatus sp. Gsoil 973]QGN32893.1 DUF4038 domain-containing protein [Microlunatus sp. Gsoil 973]